MFRVSGPLRSAVALCSAAAVAIGLVFATPTVAAATTISGNGGTGTVLVAGTTLSAGGYVYSGNGEDQLIMQGDGNLVVVSLGHPIWASDTSGNPGATATMQGDGNLVVYSSTGTPLWSTNTSGHGGASAVMQDDGNLVVYSASRAGLWGSSSYNDALYEPTTLAPGQWLVNPAETCKLVMEGDGNLVEVTSSGTPIWASGTGGNPGATVTMQGDGNLVIYSATGAPLWGSGTSGNDGGAWLSFHNDGNLVVTSASGGALWVSGKRVGSLPSATTLHEDQYVVSGDGVDTLNMQEDGNLVVISLGHAIWASGTSGNPGAYAVMQGDGNLVVYSSSGAGLWASGTSGHGGASVVMQDDGNLVVYSSTGALWAGGSFNNALYAPTTLAVGQWLTIPAETYKLVMQGDGNLVDYTSGGTAVWASGTSGNSGATATMQGDGNLVIYTSGGTPLWSTNTSGNGGAHLTMQTDGSLVVSSSSGTSLWSSAPKAASGGVSPSTTDDYPSAWRNADKDGNGLGTYWGYNRECVSYAAWELYRMNGGTQTPTGTGPGSIPSDWSTYSIDVSDTYGDAGDWATHARANGVPVNDTPTEGSIAEWNRWSNTSTGQPDVNNLDAMQYGHVAVVTAVNSDGSIDIAQYNLRDDGKFSTLQIPSHGRATDTSNGHNAYYVYWPSNFIHFNGR